MHLVADGHVRSWVDAAAAKGGFNQQNGVAINPADDSLFVVDTFEQRVQKFNTASTCTSVSSCPAWELQFAGRSAAGTDTEGVGYPRALTFGDGKVWIGDNNNDVQAWTPGGTSTSQPAQFVHRFGSQGKSPGQFSGGVQGLRVQGGRVYATDYAGCRLQVFDEAKLLTVGLGTSALEALVGDTGCTTMKGPRGVAVDPSNPAIVYVAETGANRITKWNLNLGSPGHPGGGTATRITSCGLSQPWGITYHAGAYYIGDVGHSRIMKLNPGHQRVQRGGERAAEGRQLRRVRQRRPHVRQRQQQEDPGLLGRQLGHRSPRAAPGTGCLTGRGRIRRSSRVSNDRLAGSGYWRLAWGRLRRDPLARGKRFAAAGRVLRLLHRRAAAGRVRSGTAPTPSFRMPSTTSGRSACGRGYRTPTTPVST